MDKRGHYLQKVTNCFFFFQLNNVQYEMSPVFSLFNKLSSFASSFCVMWDVPEGVSVSGTAQCGSMLH